MSNFKKIQQEMKNSGLRALLLSDEADRLYASGFHTTDGAVLILQDKAYYITDSRYIEAANEAVRDAVVLMSSTENKEKDIIKRLLTENSISELGAQEDKELIKLAMPFSPSISPNILESCSILMLDHPAVS